MFNVFIGSSLEGRPYAEFIEESLAGIGIFTPLPWWREDVFRPNKSYLEALFEALSRVDAAILIATPDDITIKRGQKRKAIRDNILLEYGLFAGHLGRMNALLVQIGANEVPSDLKGISMVRAPLDRADSIDADGVLREQAREVLARTTQTICDHLLRPPDGASVLDSSFFRQPAAHNAKPELMRVLRVHQRRLLTSRTAFSVADRELQKIVKANIEDRSVALGGGHDKTVVGGVINVERMSTEDLQSLSRAYASHIARTLTVSFRQEDIPTRFAIHWKREQRSDMIFTKEVLRGLDAKPAIVDLEGGFNPSVTGYYIPDETVAFLHDFTLSGRIPAHCINELRCNGLNVRAMFSFIARREHLEEIRDNCADANLQYFPFAYLDSEGRLEVVR